MTLSNKILIKHWLSVLYWKWRFSWLSKPWYAIKTFLFIQWHARKIAINLDNCLRVLGQAKHTSNSPDKLSIQLDARTELIHKGYQILPSWKWRK